MSDIKFDCPKCGRHMVGEDGLVGQSVTCPDCGAGFQPLVKFESSGEAAYEKYLARHKKRGPRDQAVLFSFLAAVLVVVSGIILIISLVNSDFSMSGAYVVAGLLGLASWLYVIAQIIHIRANTEK